MIPPTNWISTRNSGDKYIFDNIKKGIEKDLPEFIQIGVDDSQNGLLEKRKCWVEPAPEEYALPTENWREVVERRKQYHIILDAIESGKVTKIQDFIEYNLDICSFTQDLLDTIDDSAFIRAFYEVLQEMTILDPTCGSGAFLFAALNILEPLYSSCISRMEDFMKYEDALPRNTRQLFIETINSKNLHANKQYFIIKSIVSNMLNTDKVSENAIKSVIYHEYTHQCYRDHNAKFNARMKLFSGYDICQKELEDYFNSIDNVPDAQKTDIILDASDEIVFCKFPYEPENMDSYWQHLLYFNHYLTGFLSGNVPEEYCRKPIKQVIWVVETFKIMYVVGWAKNVQLFPTIQKVNVRGSGVGTVEYQFKYIQDEGKVLLPCNVFECLFEGESPASLVKQGICKSSEIDGGILKEIVDIVNSYDGDYIDVGIMDSTLDAIPGIETDNVSELIKLANEADSRDRRFLIMNKAVSLEKSYRTYLHRGLAFFDCWIFDKALDDFSKALQYEKDDLEMIEKPEVEKYIMKAQKAMTVLK